MPAHHPRQRITRKANALGLHCAAGVRLVQSECNDLICSSDAFISEDGRKYEFFVCGVCKRALLLEHEQAVHYRHGSECSTYAVPDFVKVPDYIRYPRNKKKGEQNNE